MIRTRLAALVLACCVTSSRSLAAPAPVEVPAEIARDFRVVTDPETGCVVLLHAWWGDPMIFGHEGCAGGPIRAGLIERARDFLWSHAELLRLRRDVEDLALSNAYECLGSFYVDFGRLYRGVRVFGGAARVRFDPDGRIEAVGVECMPGIEIDAAPKILRDEAAVIAAKAISGAIPGGTSVEEPIIRRREHAILSPEPDSTRSEADPDDLFLVWEVVVRTRDRWPWKVFVDAHSGAVLSKSWMIPIDR